MTGMEESTVFYVTLCQRFESRDSDLLMDGKTKGEKVLLKILSFFTCVSKREKRNPHGSCLIQAKDWTQDESPHPSLQH